MTEEGTVKIHFGDGKYGRRLPTGKNNVRVRYRVGSGISGNVAARSLEKAVNPHPLVESIVQWQSASGGGDMEDSSSLRDNAPPTLLALQRAVSLADFSHLASAQSSIWQAKAYNEVLHGGRSEKVRVVIVAAGGVSSNDIKKELKNYLQQQALPGVLVCVDDFVPALFDLTVTIRVDSSAYNPAQVQSAVSSALTDHFALKNRALGAHLYLSEAYKVVEAVEGVENSICLLNDDERLKVITATDQSMVIYLDSAAGSTLSIAAEEYQP
jgi:predicted phage baseplate assembly protein